MKPLSDKKTKTLNTRLAWAVKWIVAIVALVYIVIDVYYRVQLHDTMALYHTCLNDKRLIWSVPVIITLIIANWSLDVLKWRWAMQKIEQLSFWVAFRAMFTGLTISFFTPNRVGEYAGRVLFMRRADKIKGILITVLCSFSQLMITIVVGLFSLIFYIRNIFITDAPIVYWIFTSIILLLIFLTVLLYFNIHVVDWLFKKWHLSRKFTRYTKVFYLYSTLELAKLVGLSAFRYLIFSFQFYLVLNFFNVDISLFKAFEMMSLTYLTIAIVPTFALTEIGVRGSASLYFFGIISSNAVGILTSSLTVWITNIAVPSAVGAFCILYIRVRK